MLQQTCSSKPRTTKGRKCTPPKFSRRVSSIWKLPSSAHFTLSPFSQILKYGILSTYCSINIPWYSELKQIRTHDSHCQLLNWTLVLTFPMTFSWVVPKFCTSSKVQAHDHRYTIVTLTPSKLHVRDSWGCFHQAIIANSTWTRGWPSWALFCHGGFQRINHPSTTLSLTHMSVVAVKHLISHMYIITSELSMMCMCNVYKHRFTPNPTKSRRI